MWIATLVIKTQKGIYDTIYIIERTVVPRPSETEVSVLCRFDPVFFSLDVMHLSGGNSRRATCQACANSLIL